MRLPSPTAETTRAAGRQLGESLGDEDVVLGLVGPLGAGKTLFVKGLAEGLGLDPAFVASPTFVIANEYPLRGGRRLVHVDCYRLERIEELENVGWLDWLAPGSVVAVEWPDRIPGVLPADHLRLEIGRSGAEAEDSQRELNAIASLAGAERILARWREALAASPELRPLPAEP